MSKHAILSASSSYRWLKCPPSALLCAKEKDAPSDYAVQGTQAHELCEHKLKMLIGLPSKINADDMEFYNEEMESCTDEYAQYVEERLEVAKAICKDPVLLIEQRLDFSKWVPSGFGTGDAVIVADEVLNVIDFKYGLGVLVEAKDNPQMMCYALGAISIFDSIYDIEEITMTIFQPRRENISTYTIRKDELLSWAENTLAPVASLAAKGEGEFSAGEHCRFCKIKAVCRKRAEYAMELARYDFKEPDTLDTSEIAHILTKADELSSWAADVKEYALAEALRGTRFDGFKLVEGRSNRKYVSESKVAEAVEKIGKDPYEKKLLGVTAMTRMLGKKTFDEVLGEFVYKPEGKPTLVPESDKRPELNNAKEDFMEEENND